MTTPDQRIKRYISLKDHLAAESKRFAEYCQPYKDEMAQIEAEFLKRFLDEKTDSIRTDEGTAYKSELMTPTVIDREAYIDYCMEHWSNGGDAIMQLASPKKEALREYMETHEGQLPPGTKVEYFTRVNIRRG